MQLKLLTEGMNEENTVKTGVRKAKGDINSLIGRFIKFNNFRS